MTSANTLQIPQDILDSAKLTIDELKVELAASLYARGRLSAGKTRELAGMSLWAFRQFTAIRGITVHYDAEDLQDDVDTLHELGRI